MCAALLAPLRGSFTLAPGLWALIVSAPAGLGKNTVLLYFTVELLECDLKRIAWINFYFAHQGYQRDLRSFERLVPIVW
jgi:hypothetical protein